MSPEQVIRAWKDADFGACLRSDEAGAVPAHPVGPIDIDDCALSLAGGDLESTEYVETFGCCQGFTQAGKCDVTAGYPYCTGGCLTIVWTHWDWCKAT